MATTAGVGCVLAGTGAWYVAGKLVAPANRSVGAPPGDLPADDLELPCDGGAAVAGWRLPTHGARATVLLLHPIGGDRRSMLSRARLFRERGFSVITLDLQAHGESPGEAITLGHRERHGVRAAVRFARQQSPDHRIGVVGRSLGGAAALLGSPLPIDALVLESVYPTITEAVHNRVAIRVGPLHHILAPMLLCQLRPRLGISTADLRPIDKLPTAGCPVLIATGDQDRHTPPAEARRMFDAAVEPKEFVVFEGAGHHDLLEHDPRRYEETVLRFLDRHLLPGG